MNSLKIDMMEATRLTREGRLDEAMAILQGGPVSKRAARAPASGGPTIEMVPPRLGSGGAWTAPDAPGRRAPGMPEALRGLADRLGRPGAGTPLNMPLGTPLGGRPAPEVAVPPGARWEGRVLDDPAGRLAYKLYVPSGQAGRALPLVVMLHGCTQSPDDFAAGTRMNEVAEEQGLLVAYPEQSRTANAQRCWNWFSPADQQRGRGEPALIAAIAGEVLRETGGDGARTYVAGLSAGGAAAAVMGAAYPDLFAAVGVHSGLACGAARDVASAFGAMRQGGGAPAPWRAAVPAIVFHGDRDATVHPVNGDEVAAQARGAARLSATTQAGVSPGGTRYTRVVHADAGGRAVHEQWVLHGAGHAWSGGSAAGSYTDPAGPDASREMVRFFLEHRLQGA